MADDQEFNPWQHPRDPLTGEFTQIERPELDLNDWKRGTIEVVVNAQDINEGDDLLYDGAPVTVIDVLPEDESGERSFEIVYWQQEFAPTEIVSFLPGEGVIQVLQQFDAAEDLSEIDEYEYDDADRVAQLIESVFANTTPPPGVPEDYYWGYLARQIKRVEAERQVNVEKLRAFPYNVLDQPALARVTSCFTMALDPDVDEWVDQSHLSHDELIEKIKALPLEELTAADAKSIHNVVVEDALVMFDLAMFPEDLFEPGART